MVKKEYQTIYKKAQIALAKLNIDNATLIGTGGEGFVYTYKKNDVIKIYHKDYITTDYLQNLSLIQHILSQTKFLFSTPQIKEIGCIENTYYSIEKKLAGANMKFVFPKASKKTKFRLLKSYYETIQELNSITLAQFPYGNIVHMNESITDPNWPQFLIKKMKQRISKASPRLCVAVQNLDQKMQLFSGILKKFCNIDTKHFIHADYFVDQVLVNDKHTISAILDIGHHAVAGDPRLDQAQVPIFYGLPEYTSEYVEFLTKLQKKDFGDTCTLFNSIYKGSRLDNGVVN